MKTAFGAEIWKNNNETAKVLFGTERWSKQREIGDKIVRHKYVAAATCHAIGKTELAAELAIQFLLAHYPARVVITSASWGTAEDTILARMRSKVAKVRKRFPALLPPSKTQWHPFGKDHEHLIICASPKERENIAGRHNDHVFVIVDEASALDRAIYGAILGILVRPTDRLLFTGNPLSVSGPFADALTLYKAESEEDDLNWHTVHVSAYDSPNFNDTGEVVYPNLISPGYVDKMKREFNEDPAEIMPRIYGQIPDLSDTTIISRQMLTDACNQDEPARRGDLVMSVDLSWGGDDYTVFMLRDDAGVIAMETTRGKYEPELVRMILEYRDRWNPRRICVDATGNPSVWHMLEDQGCHEVEGVVYSRRAHDGKRFFNVRAEFYWNLRQALRNGFHIPKEMILPFLDQCGLEMTRQRGKILIEDKDKLKARIGRSPDEMDCLAQSFTKSLGDTAFDAVSSRHQMAAQPVISKDGEGWRLQFKDMPAISWPGILMRSIWVGKAGESACVWVHVDHAGCWRVFDALKTSASMFELAAEVEARSKGHEYTYNLISSDDEARVMLSYQDIVERMVGEDAEFPGWVEPTRLKGKSGAETLDRLLIGAMAYYPEDEFWEGRSDNPQQYQTGDMILFWPQDVLASVERAVLKPPDNSSHDQESGKEELVAGGGAYLKALRMLCVHFSDFAELNAPTVES